jgi:hypothetical protein
MNVSSLRANVLRSFKVVDVHFVIKHILYYQHVLDIEDVMHLCAL